MTELTFQAGRAVAAYSWVSACLVSAVSAGTLEQRLVQLREAYEFVTRYNGHAPYRATKVQRQPNGQHLELVSWPSSGPQEDGCDDSCAVETDDEAEELQAAATGPQGVLAHFEGDLQAVDPGAAAVVAAALNGAAGSRLLVFSNSSGGGAAKLQPVQQFQSAAAAAALSNMTTGAGSLTGCIALTAEDAGCVTSSETQGQPHLARRDGVMGLGSGSASPPPAAALARSISRSLSRNRSR